MGFDRGCLYLKELCIVLHESRVTLKQYLDHYPTLARSLWVGGVACPHIQAPVWSGKTSFVTSYATWSSTRNNVIARGAI